MFSLAKSLSFSTTRKTFVDVLGISHTCCDGMPVYRQTSRRFVTCDAGLPPLKKGMPLHPLAGFRPYVEALPRFNILTLDHEIRRGALRMHWTDQNGVVVGAAHVTRHNQSIVAFTYFMNHVNYTSEFTSRDFVKITRENPDDFVSRPSAICGGCNKPKNIILYYEERWLCSQCHYTTNISAMLDIETRSYLRFVELAKTAEQPRPRYMRHGKYDEILAEYRRVFPYWASRPPRTLASHHLPRVNVHYYTPEEAPDIGTTEHFDESDPLAPDAW